VKKDYIRYAGKSDPVALGTYTLQTSGNAPLTGKAVDCSDFTWHSYQVTPVAGGVTYQGEFHIQLSNDGKNWREINGMKIDARNFSDSNSSFSNISEASGVFTSVQFLSKYARPVLSGNASADYIISEIHRQ